jgi:signal transduction histidine kinase
VGTVPPGQRNGHFFSLPDLLCADLMKEQQSLGYVAVRIKKDESRLFNARPVDYLKVIASQAVSFLDKKKAMDERKQSEKEALLGSMLSMIVHDMKNPLCGASGFAQLIKQKSDDEKIRNYSDKILDVLERLERMNAELLMYVRGESIRLEKTDVGLQQLFEELISGLKAAYRQMNIDVGIHCRNNEEITVSADRDRLIRVFSNILANAREAIDKNGSINIELSMDGPKARILICDSGRGMPAHIRQRAFEPFVTHGKKKGTGLGLAIARTIIEQHGGKIKVESTLGKGTTLIINLPVS